MARAACKRHADRSGWELRVGEAIPRMMVTVNGTHHYAQPDNPWSSRRLRAGQWHHLAGTYDGQKIVMYVDGLPWFTQPLSGGISEYPCQSPEGKRGSSSTGGGPNTDSAFVRCS